VPRRHHDRDTTTITPGIIDPNTPPSPTI